MIASLMLLFSCADLSILEDDIEISYQTWCAPRKTVPVTRVYDGDTFIVLNEGEEQTIRMLGVAAPEIEGSDSPAECYGVEAEEFLRSVILNEQVRLEFDVECTDIYGRTLAWVVLEGNDPEIRGLMESFAMTGTYYEDGSYEVLVNEMLIRMGYATAFDGELDQSVRYSAVIEDSEAAAEMFQEGLWNECN